MRKVFIIKKIDSQNKYKYLLTWTDWTNCRYFASVEDAKQFAFDSFGNDIKIDVKE